MSLAVVKKDAREKKTEGKDPGVSCATKKKTIFPEFICSGSNDVPGSDHSLDVCTMCQRGKCVCRYLDKTRFHQAVTRLLSMKYHIISSGIVWGFFGIFRSLSDSIKMRTKLLVKKGPTRRARLVLGGGRMRPSLC